MKKNEYNDNYKDNFTLINTGERSDLRTIKLNEEILDVSTIRLPINDVNIRKETVTMNKTITIPITSEELVIETKAASPNGQDEIMRIPLSSETIEVIKHPTQLEKVNIYTRHVQDIEHVNEILKREQIRIEKTGNPTIIVNDTEL
ncbi:YsnF/AvaK domain-containing protein [Neobacillus sp. LXY-4]|uniref:YsnF/AvaK domain-containing protein n=1 Tax=Neobacillus sp. LXY-4 TaxID=3379826 RepID=UPI003EE22C46